jgi:hypothetical protein
MKEFRSLAYFVFLLTALSVLAVPATSQGADLVLDAQLIWGTDDASSPNPKHKEVEPGLAKKLSNFKWKKYFEEERKTVTIPEKGSQKVRMSPSCQIEIFNLGGDKIDVKLFGHGKPVVHQKGESLAGGQLVVIGGDAKNDTAWFITLRKTKP